MKQRQQLTELKKRSDYLCTLTFSPAWQRKFGQRLIRLHEVVQEENRKTVQLANEVARRHGWPANYVLGARRPTDAITFPVEGFDGGSVSMLAVQLG